MPEDWYIYFYNEEGKQIASEDYVSIPLYEGMVVTIHGSNAKYAVDGWRLHIGHPDEEPGLHVNLRRI